MMAIRIDHILQKNKRHNIVLAENYPLVNIQRTMERSTMFNGKIHYKLPFSIAMLT